MSAAVEYYGYLLSKGYTGYTDSQIDTFSELGERVNSGEISMNQAFKQAKSSGFTNSNGEKTDSTFKEWVTTAEQAGWIDKGMGYLSQKIKDIGKKDDEIYASPSPTFIPDYEPEKKKTGTWIGVGVGVIIVVVGIYYLSKRNKTK